MAEGGKNTFYHSWVEMGKGMCQLIFPHLLFRYLGTYIHESIRNDLLCTSVVSMGLARAILSYHTYMGRHHTNTKTSEQHYHKKQNISPPTLQTFFNTLFPDFPSII